MRIGLITHQWPGARAGGVGTYVWQAANALAGAGHDVHVFTLTLPPDAVVSARVRVHEVKDLAIRIQEGMLPLALATAVESGGEAEYRLAIGWLFCEEVRTFHRAEKAAGRGGLDVVEGPEYEALALPLLLQPEANLAVVTHLHLCSAIARRGNAGGDTEFKMREAKAGEELIDALEFGAIALADGLCAPTQFIANETQQACGGGMAGREVTIVPHPMAITEECSPPPTNGAVLFVGRLEPLKGTELMPGAFNRFLGRNPDARIRLVGSDTHWGDGKGAGQSVRARIEAGLDTAVRERVVFVGEKSPEDVRREFSACRFSIVPSLLESFGYVAAESMMAGRAVAVSSEIGATEVVGDGGVVFERGSAEGLAAAMEGPWRDRQLCAELGRKARARIVGLASVENTVHRRVVFYQAVATGLRTRERNLIATRLAELDKRHDGPLLEALAMFTGTSGGVTWGAAKASEESAGERLLRIMEGISHKGNGAAVFLYGAGRHTARLLAQRHVWESRGHRVAGLIDDHPRFVEEPQCYGLPVMSLKTAEEKLGAGDVVVLSTDAFEEQFWRQTAGLREKGVGVYRIYEDASAPR